MMSILRTLVIEMPLGWLYDRIVSERRFKKFVLDSKEPWTDGTDRCGGR
jgi:hypothetical protein